MEKKSTNEMEIITAEKYIYKMLDTHPVNGTQFCVINAGEGSIKAVMIEFAKAHVQKALAAASNNATVKNLDGGQPVIKVVDKTSILNAYPLENIK